MIEKLIEALENRFNLKGLCELESYRELKDIGVGIKFEYLDEDLIVYTFIKMLKENEIEIVFKNKESKDYKYLKKGLGEDK